MADEIKFTDEELKSLQELSQNYQNIQASFGQIKVQKILNQQQTDALEEAEVKMDADYKEIQDNERELVQQLNEKYGPGQLDPQTGVFTTNTTRRSCCRSRRILNKSLNGCILKIFVIFIYKNFHINFKTFKGENTWQRE